MTLKFVEKPSRVCPHRKQKGVRLDAPNSSLERRLELAPQELVGDLVVELNLWDFDDAA